MSNAHHFVGTPGRSQRGLAMVEFVLAAPVLLLLLFASAEFSRMMIHYSAINDGVRAAARYVAGKALEGTNGQLLQGAAWNTLITQGRNMAVYGNAAGAGAPILPNLTVANINVAGNAANNNITVTSNYPYQAVFAGGVPTFIAGSISTNITLSISTTMRAL
jgi:Flp pilus assembly protein TadG